MRQRGSRHAAVSPVGQGTITTMAPLDMIQCAMDCSTYCRVLPVNSGRAGSACEKQADKPIRVGAWQVATWQQAEQGDGLVLTGCCGFVV